jgi:hypothetical protein
MSSVALVVGINEYDHLDKLTSPARDAQAIADILRKHGEFHVTPLPTVKDTEKKIGQGEQQSPRDCR